MSVKCNACGFDSADGADWCEMCKEPFHKKAQPKAAPAPGPAPAPARAQSAAPAPAEAQAAAELAALKNLSPEELIKRLPMELGRDPAQKIPAVPPWFRMAAYAFTFAMALLTLALVVTAVQRARQAPPPKAQQTLP